MRSRKSVHVSSMCVCVCVCGSKEVQLKEEKGQRVLSHR